MQVKWALVGGGGRGGQQGIVFFASNYAFVPGQEPMLVPRLLAVMIILICSVLVEKLLIMRLCLSSVVASPMLPRYGPSNLR